MDWCEIIGCPLSKKTVVWDRLMVCGPFDVLTKSSHGADSVLTGGWDTTSAMENKNGNKERRTRIEIAIGLTVVALLYLIDWLSR